MLIKHFREAKFRTRDPLHPGQFVLDRRLEPANTTHISHGDREFVANKQGWFDVPEEVGNFWLSRPGWRTPQQVDEAVIAGEIDENDSPLSPRRPNRAKAE